MIPASILTSVVLPAPFGPSRPTISPSLTSSETPTTACFATRSRRKSDLIDARKPGAFLWT